VLVPIVLVAGLSGAVLARRLINRSPLLADGGGLWGALARWSGGGLASLASHILWTGAMLGLPPKVGGTEGDG
jgi:hypothetical protein